MNRPAGQRTARAEAETSAERIQVRGIVQGVGFRPAVWRLARQHGLRGSVGNDGQGVTIIACGTAASLSAFVAALRAQEPPLARIESIERTSVAELPESADFRIVDSLSQAGQINTHVVPDAATCPACQSEIADPFARRYRYPFTNCTHCGPRLSIIEAIPYDRVTTTMREFALCPACAAEFADPDDRRFHAQPIACPVCGPHAWLERADGAPPGSTVLDAVDAVDAACTLVARGQIIAVKGLGGFQLACDACNDHAVSRLRALKQRERKPFALMARDLDVVKRFCSVSEKEETLLLSPEAPIVIVQRSGPAQVSPSVAPGLATLGFMLPNTPLHHLMLRRMTRPMVLTSGNLSDEPQCIANAEARVRLGGIADYFLLHDREIARRLDDSIVRVMAGAPQLMRRARGYAPAPIRLPPGFAAAPPVLAMGGELKNSFCLLRGGQAIVSHHMGDLADARCHADYVHSITQYAELFAHEPDIVAADLHPEYLSRKLGLEMADRRGLVFSPVQHHHAHIAACMAENGIALDAAPVIGVALDGLGYGADGALWGGEFLLADYRECRRIGRFKPVAMPGGEQAIREPWRNTYAQLMAAMSWEEFTGKCGELELYRYLASKPRALIDRMIAGAINSPPASSCGRLFDAVAAASDVCRERARYEGQAAVEFEALVDRVILRDEGDSRAYPFALARNDADGMEQLDAQPMWQALLEDLRRGTRVPVLAARFHKGLAITVARLVDTLGRVHAAHIVALSGGVFQNCVLLEQVVMRLQALGFTVLTHHRVPANDGGLALGQAAVAAARALNR